MHIMCPLSPLPLFKPWLWEIFTFCLHLDSITWICMHRCVNCVSFIIRIRSAKIDLKFWLETHLSLRRISHVVKWPAYKSGTSLHIRCGGSWAQRLSELQSRSSCEVWGGGHNSGYSPSRFFPICIKLKKWMNLTNRRFKTLGSCQIIKRVFLGRWVCFLFKRGKYYLPDGSSSAPSASVSESTFHGSTWSHTHKLGMDQDWKCFGILLYNFNKT